MKLSENSWYVEALLIMLSQGGFDYATYLPSGIQVTLSEENVFHLANVVILEDMYFRVETDTQTVDKVHYTKLIETLKELSS